MHIVRLATDCCLMCDFKRYIRTIAFIDRNYLRGLLVLKATETFLTTAIPHPHKVMDAQGFRMATEPFRNSTHVVTIATSSSVWAIKKW
jgi:hypothetical protein